MAYFIVLIVLRCTHEYFSKVLSTYLSTFTKCVLSTYSSTFKTVSTQYLLEYFFLVLASSLLMTYVLLQDQWVAFMEESIFLGFNKMQVNFEQQHEQTRGRLCDEVRKCEEIIFGKAILVYRFG